jgi:hypothetical protein
VLLLSDGRHNRPDSARRAAAVVGAPIHAVALGAEQRPKDVAVAAVVTDTSYVKDVAEAFAKVKTDGLPAGLPLSVRLIEGDKLLDTQPLIVPAGEKLSTVRFQFPAGEKPGRRSLAVQIDPLPGEAFEENNRKAFSLHVSDKRIRVLLIEDLPRWCFQYVRNLLQRDKKVEATPILLRPAAIRLEGDRLDEAPGRQMLEKLVSDRDKLMGFDVVIFGDVDPARLSTEQMTHLHDFVFARGGTLILIAGKRHMPAGYGNTPLKDLLAVRLPTETDPRPPAGGADRREGPKPFRIRLTDEGERHDICRLAEEQDDNRKIWNRLPRFQWHSRFTAARQNARVLAFAHRDEPRLVRPVAQRDERTDARDHALLMTTRFGLGKVFYLATDRMWRLRYRRGDPHHHRFWGQVLRWATAEKLSVRSKHFGLGTDEIVYDEGEPIRVTARVLTKEMTPLAGAVVRAELTAGERIITRTLLIHQPGSGGLYQGSIARVPPGSYTLRLDVPALAALLDEDTDGAGVQLDLDVRDQPSAEQIELATNRQLLDALAAVSGGKVHRVDGARRIPAALGEPTWQSDPQFRAATLWDSWVMLAVFVGLVTIEWVLRKRAGLI